MIAPFDYRREIATQDDKYKLLYLFINNTAVYVLAYILAYTLYQVATSLVANTFDIKTIIYYHKIDYRVKGDFWNPPRVIFTFMAGPVICLLVGIVCYRVYLVFKKASGYAKTFFLWFYIHGVNLFFGSYVAGFVTRSGFRYVTNYLSVPRKAEYGIAFVCVVVMFAVGFFATRSFLQLAPSQSLIQRFSRGSYILTACIAPWIAGSLILLIFKLPQITINELIVYLMVFTVIVPIIIVQRNFQEVNLVRQTKPVSISWIVVGATIGALVIFRSVFEYGLSIG